MKRATIFCKHYRAMSDHTTCEAGVQYAKFRGLRFDQKPCFWHQSAGEAPPPGCHLALFPTEEEIAEEEEEMRVRLEGIANARQAIVEHLGGPWKKGIAGSRGSIDCPVCGVGAALHFTRAGSNGHIHAQCETQGCVAWMEGCLAWMEGCLSLAGIERRLSPSRLRPRKVPALRGAVD